MQLEAVPGGGSGGAGAFSSLETQDRGPPERGRRRALTEVEDEDEGPFEPRPAMGEDAWKPREGQGVRVKADPKDN